MIALCICVLVLLGNLAATRAIVRKWHDALQPALLVAVMMVVLFLFAVLLNTPVNSAPDARTYQQQAQGVWLSLTLTGQVDSAYAPLDLGKAGWPTILGHIYDITGTDNPYIGVFIGTNVAYLALLLTVLAGVRLWCPSHWRPSICLLILASPQFLMVSASLLRESWSWLAIALAVNGVISLCRRAPSGALLVLAGVLLAYWIRAPLSAILLAGCTAGIAVAWVWARWGVRRAIIAVAFAGVAGRALLTPVLAMFGYGTEHLLVAREELAETATTGFTPTSPFSPVGLALSLIRVGLGPLPWEYRPGAAWIWVAGNWAHWIVLLAVVVVVLRRRPAEAATVALVTLSAVILVGLSVGLTNYGVVVRMRASIMIPLIPIAWGILRPRTLEPQAGDRDPPGIVHDSDSHPMNDPTKAFRSEAD